MIGSSVMKEWKVCENTMFRAVVWGFWKPVYRFGDQKCNQRFWWVKKKNKSVIVLKIYFRAHDAFQQHLKTVKNILKLPHCILKTTLAQLYKSKNEIMIETFLVIRHFRTFSLCPNSVNCDHICSCPLKKITKWKRDKGLSFVGFALFS